MMLEIIRKRSAIEIHQTNDDESVTVWVCENEQAAMFKLASIVFTREEKPEEAKRSILVGTFSAKKEPKRVDLEELAKKVAEEFAKKGMQFQKMGPTPNLPEDEGPIVPSILPYTDPYGGQMIGVALPSTTIDGLGTGQQPSIDVNILGPNGSSAAKSGGDLDVNQVLSYMDSLDKVNGCFGLVDTPIGEDELVEFTGTYKASNVQAFHTTITTKNNG